MDDTPANSIDFRRRCVEDTTSFIVKECSFLGDLLAQMHWTPEYILRKKVMIQCPHDLCHYVPEASLKKHTLKCELFKRGCPREDMQLQMQNDDVAFEKAELVGKVQIDEKLLNTIIQHHYMENGQVFTGHRALPTCPTDACVTMPREERIAIYDYCVQQLKGQGKMPNIEKDEILTTDWEKIIKKGLLEQEEGKPQTAQELLALLRDQKRRRQSYRAKNVHITRKSYTEIIREVINNQMEMLMPSQEVLNRPESDERERIASDRKEEIRSPTSRRHLSQEGTRDSYSRDQSLWSRQKGRREKTKKVRRHGDRQSSERDHQEKHSYVLGQDPDKRRNRNSPSVPQQRKRHTADSDSDSRQRSKKHKRKHKKHKNRHSSFSDDSSTSCR